MKDADWERKRDLRQEQHLRRLGTRNPHCTNCGETDPAALTGMSPHILCYRCKAFPAGRSPKEEHHPAGWHNSPVTVPIPANDHRVLSDMQRGWPESTLRNPDGSPLLVAAAMLRGWLDVLQLIIERTVGRIPTFLEVLDQGLRSELGEQWWERLGLQGTTI